MKPNKKQRKKALNRDIKVCLKKSKGRFISILSLMALGSFALVGLQVTGPDMRETGKTYFNEYNMADIMILGGSGIDEDNEKKIKTLSGTSEIEFGYLKDVVISDTNDSFRILSATESLSQYEIISGRMPETKKEIALTNIYSDSYSIGDTISFTEKADVSGEYALSEHTFEIVGFVESTEFLTSVNMGQSTAGTGELKGFAVVIPETFDTDYTMIARISFEDTKDLDPYSDEYSECIQTHKQELETLLEDQPQERLEAIQKTYQDSIESGQNEVDDAKKEISDNQEKLDEAQEEINSAETEISEKQSELDNKVANGESELESASKSISDSELTLKQAKVKLDSAKNEIDDNEQTLAEAKLTLDSASEQIAEKEKELEQASKTLESAEKEISENESALESAQAQIEQAESEYNAQKSAFDETVGNYKLMYPELETLPSELTEAQAKLEVTKQQIDASKAEIAEKQKLLETAKEEYDSGKKEYESGKTQLDSAKETYSENLKEYESGVAQLNSAKQTYQSSLSEYNAGVAKLKSAKNSYNDGKAELDSQEASAEAKISEAESELDDAKAEYLEKSEEFKTKKADAEEEIAEAESELDDARNDMENLDTPTFTIDTRRELPGSEGYDIYQTVSEIVDKLGRVFPVFMYFVAALMTLTTMTRFVDEERLNIGTLKALGYEDRDIMKKFMVYGFISSTAGAIIGIVLGHTLLPFIVYNTYGENYVFPKIELHFYPVYSIIALLLAWCCAVIPAIVVAEKALREKTTALLLPKAPASGSKILLERITPIWKHLSFTQKVTARNIFRYKKRMFMTIFGVCGAATLLFTGFSVQKSVSGINDRQFGELMQYNLIAAYNNNLSDDEVSEIENIVGDENIVEQSLSICYETYTKVAGDKNDKQEITVLIPEDKESFKDYITLVNRKSGESIELGSDGVVLSERLAELLDAEKGDIITLNDENGKEQTMSVAGVTEMYTGHFMFMSSDYYTSVTNEDYDTNADLIILCDGSQKSTNNIAGKLMELDAVKGVVQNSTLINQISTIVDSLDKIMDVLIIIAVMLGAVILFNLTNINVSERMRELSTVKVLGFYDKEVTMYIYRETVLLTIMGIITGWLVGDWLYLYILDVVPPAEVMFNPALGAKAFIMPVLTIGLTTLILGFIIHRKLKYVDMLEALKSVE